MNLLLGGMVCHNSKLQQKTAALDFAPGAWRHNSRNYHMFLGICGDAWSTGFAEDSAVLLRGYASPRSSDKLPSQQLFAQEWLRQHRDTGRLSLENVEGSFTIISLDARSEEVTCYRNLVGTGYTYYYQSGNELLFSSNLPTLLQFLTDSPPLNRHVLPVLFTYRYPIGQTTLFEGIRRLMPGELLQFTAGHLDIQQKQTLADFQDTPIAADQAIEQLESTMARVMQDCYAIDPHAAVLLSGGVDSSYIQAHWNQVCSKEGTRPISSVVAVDHPMTLGDREYARTAAKAFDTEHIEVLATEPFGHSMVSTMAATGEVLSHAQTAYFKNLATNLHQRGIRTGICGEGADGLFGTDWIATFRRAKDLCWIPGWLSRLLGKLARLAGRPWLDEALNLNALLEDRQDPRNPINRLGTFTHLPSVQDSFGRTGLAQALELRQDLLSQYRVRDNALERVHAIGFLGESVETASLWNACFEVEGLSMLNPFLDSRVLRYVVNLEPEYRYAPGPPKRALRDALLRHASPDLVYRSKLAFGQPIFEYLSANGQLRPLVNSIADYDFVPSEVLALGKRSPNWFLYTLLCFDLWYKTHVNNEDIVTSVY